MQHVFSNEHQLNASLTNCPRNLHDKDKGTMEFAIQKIESQNMLHLHLRSGLRYIAAQNPSSYTPYCHE
jgi:hypothetical protein